MHIKLVLIFFRECIRVFVEGREDCHEADNIEPYENLGRVGHKYITEMCTENC